LRGKATFSRAFCAFSPTLLTASRNFSGG